MIEHVQGLYAYWFITVLLLLGLYGMLLKRNLVKKLIAMTILQSSVVLFFVSSGTKWGGTVPIVDRVLGTDDPTKYISPLPHTLMLTAIVVGVATVGVAFALLISIYSRYKTLNEDILLDRMK
ncbi:MAG: cation:proton antiporter subunit C [Ignavibacteriales bacterium]|nr:cation:proton antiporter subunit C [Ignavibacteriales bacterium]